MKLNKDAREKYMELKILQEQVEQMQKYMEELTNKQGEFAMAKESLQEFSKLKGSNEAFIPLAQGIFVPAHIEAGTDLVVNVGADTAVAKPSSQVIELLDEQIKEVGTLREQMQDNITQITQRMEKTLEELQKISG